MKMRENQVPAEADLTHLLPGGYVLAPPHAHAVGPQAYQAAEFAIAMIDQHEVADVVGVLSRRELRITDMTIRKGMALSFFSVKSKLTN